MNEYHRKLKLVRCNNYHCNTFFRTKKEERQHTEHAHAAGNNQLKCIFCGISMLKTCMRRHLKNIHKSKLRKAFKCTFHCLRYFLTKEERDDHITSFHKKVAKVKKEFKCIYCKRMYPNKKCLQNHVTRSHAHKIHCNLYGCGQYFLTRTKLKDHKEQVHQNEAEKNYQCAECSFRAEFRNNFEAHWFKVHQVGNIPCPKCEKRFKSSISLKGHLQRSHAELKLCKHCNESFVHIREHQIQSTCKLCQQDLFCIRSAMLHSRVCKKLS